jgi:Cu/Ag efflux protein CusF
MKKLTFPAIAALSLMLVSTPALALQQAQAPPPAQDSAASMSARGELVKVDSDAKTITIKAAEGEQVFAYNDQTEVVGAREGVAGLAGKAGAQVTVQYTSEKGTKTATKIEVQGQK